MQNIWQSHLDPALLKMIKSYALAGGGVAGIALLLQRVPDAIILYAAFLFVGALLGRGFHADYTEACIAASLCAMWLLLCTTFVISLGASLFYSACAGAALAVGSCYAHDIKERKAVAVAPAPAPPPFTHIEARRKLKEIAKTPEFERVMSDANLDKPYNDIVRMVYQEKDNYIQIGEALNYGESTIKRYHAEALQRLMPYLE